MVQGNLWLGNEGPDLMLYNSGNVAPQCRKSALHLEISAPRLATNALRTLCFKNPRFSI